MVSCCGCWDLANFCCVVVVGKLVLAVLECVGLFLARIFLRRIFPAALVTRNFLENIFGGQCGQKVSRGTFRRHSPLKMLLKKE